MTQQLINVGTVPNDGTGDPARTAFQKVNADFTDLYGQAATAAANISTINTQIGTTPQFFGLDSGTANAYVVTPTAGGITFALAAGVLVRFTGSNANTGASTLNVSGSGVKTLVGQAGAACTGGEVQTTTPTWVQYTGSVWQVVGTGAQPAFVRSASEINASVTPSNYNYPIGDVRRYGAETDNLLTNDDTTAFTNAMAAAKPANGGNGQVNFYNWHKILGPMSIPDGVVVNGTGISVGQVYNGTYTPANIGCALVLNTANPITLNNRCGVINTLVITQALAPGGAYAMPFANATVATSAVAAFAGNAFIPNPTGTICDHRLENLLVLGFNFLYNGLSATGLNRPLFRRVYGDCTNGIHVVNVFDWALVDDCEMWEFTTTNQSFTTNALITRTGTAFFTGANSAWMTWRNCFEYGWQIGHDVYACQEVRHIHCGADGPPNSQPGSGCVGFRYSGAVGYAINIGCTASAQADTGFRLNSTALNTIHSIKLIAPNGHGNNSTNGYVHLQQGTASITDGFFSDNSSVGHIKMDAGIAAGALAIVNATFANVGAQPIFGDATSVSNVNMVSWINDGGTTYTGPTPKTWTPGISFGGASVGITYGLQAGSYTLDATRRRVTVDFKIILTSKGSSTGNAQITGLPFTINTGVAGNHGGGLAAYFVNFTGLTGALMISGAEGNTALNVYQTGATGIASVPDTFWTNTSIIYGTFSYYL